MNGKRKAYLQSWMNQLSILNISLIGLVKHKKLWLTKVVADNFRMDLLRPLFEDAGIEYEVIKTLEQSNHY